MIDHWWQTETGWPIAANCLGIEALPVKPGSPTKAVPGYDVRILRRERGGRRRRTRRARSRSGCRCRPGRCRRSGTTTSGSCRSYLEPFPGHYVTGDGGHLDEDGYLFVMGRIDDVINVAGHRLSTGAMEEVLATHPDVAECAVIGVPDELRGQVPLGFVVLKAGVDRDQDAIVAELVQLVRDQVGAVAVFRDARIVARLPKTRSGKILRGTMRAIAAGREYRVPSHDRRPGDPRGDRAGARLILFMLDREHVSRLF